MSHTNIYNLGRLIDALEALAESYGRAAPVRVIDYATTPAEATQEPSTVEGFPRLHDRCVIITTRTA